MRIPIIQAYYALSSPPNWSGRRGASLIAVYIVLSAIALAALNLRAAGLQPDEEAPAATREAEPGPEIDLEARRGTEEPLLMAAVRARRADAVQVLLAAGADPDDTDRLGESSLHLAVVDEPAILKSLLAAGANPNSRDAGGVTPLMLAAAAGRSDNMELLQAAGARLDMKDYQGSTIKDWALRGGHSQLADQLESALSTIPAPSATPSSGVDFADDVFVDVKFPDWFKTSFLDMRDDLQEALDAGKQGIMLFISASRCSYCKVFMDTVLEEPQTKERLTGSFDVIGLEIFDDRELTTLDGGQYRVKEFVTKNQANYTPTLIFFGDGGQQLLRIVGYYPPDRFRQVLDYLESKAYRDQSLRAYLQAGSKKGRGTEAAIIADDLFEQPPYMLDRGRMPAQRPLLVVFEEPNCAACERFHRRVLSAKSIRRLIDDFQAVQLDASDEQGRLVTPDGGKTSPARWYRELGLNYLPAILFFDEHGNEVMRLDSETLRYRMEGSLQLVRERAYEEDAQLQRWRRAKAIESIQRRGGS